MPADRADQRSCPLGYEEHVLGVDGCGDNIEIFSDASDSAATGRGASDDAINAIASAVSDRTDPGRYPGGVLPDS